MPNNLMAPERCMMLLNDFIVQGYFREAIMNWSPMVGKRH